MSNRNHTAAANVSPCHDLTHDVHGKALPPIAMIRAASAAADLIEAPLDAIEFYMSHLRSEWKGKTSVPAAEVDYYAEQVQSFLCIINDYRVSIERALSMVERTCHDGASFQG